MHKSLLSLTGIAVLGAIVLLVNGISDRVFSRFYVDLTDERLYSLSEGTKNILAKIEEPVTFRFYFSKTEGAKFPGIKLYGQRVLDLLREYERQGGGKVELEIYDPRPDTEEEEWAQKYGVTPLMLPSGEKLYMGLAAVNSLGEEDVVPVFDLSRQEFLEYDISKLIFSLSRTGKTVVGIISSLEVQGGAPPMPMPGRPPAPNQRPWILVNQLSKMAEVRHLPKDVDKIDEKVNVLMVIHPKGLAEQTLYAIDQYVMRGGSLFVAIDPYCAADQPKTDPNNPFAAMTADRSSNLKNMLSAWGVSLIEKKIAADINLATKVASGQGAVPQNFPLWLTLSGDSAATAATVNRSDMVTKQLENVMFAWSGALQVSSVEGVVQEPLFQTTNDAMLFSEQDVKMSGDNPEQILKDYRRGDQSYVLGVRISGKLKSSFPGKPGAQPADQSMSTPDQHLAQANGTPNVIVVADADFLSDNYSAYVHQLFGTQIVTLINDNLVFAANAVEHLANSNDLISLRSRGKFTRPFTRVEEIEARAQEKWRQEEALFQAQLNDANQRLSQLQAGSQGGEGKKVFTAALLDEIKQLREQRQEAQQRLRDVRRRLREDKERLGLFLFLANTFLVPILLIAGTVGFYLRKRRAESTERSVETQSGEIIEEAKA